MTGPSDPEADDATHEARHIEFKAALLLAFMALLVAGSALYLLYARGVFERTQTLVLVADNAEGVVVGMDLTFSGFPIGRVRRLELADDGNARIVIDVARKDARWLRTSSVFTLEHGLVGAPRMRAFSGVLTDAPLPDGAERTVLRGDLSAEIPRLMGTLRDLAQNLAAMTAADAPLNASLAQLRDLTERLNGPRGGVGVLMGNDRDARRLLDVLSGAQAALRSVEALAQRADAVIGRADERLLGPGGLTQDAQGAVRELQGALADARGTLRRLDGVLQEAQAIGSNVRGATTDLGSLRADVEASLRKVESLINDVQRRWPFARDAEVKLP